MLQCIYVYHRFRRGCLAARSEEPPGRAVPRITAGAPGRLSRPCRGRARRGCTLERLFPNVRMLILEETGIDNKCRHYKAHQTCEKYYFKVNATSGNERNHLRHGNMLQPCKDTVNIEKLFIRVRRKL